MREKFFDLQRFGVINNTISSVLVNGTNGNDSITNGRSGNVGNATLNGDNATLKAGNGNDTIINYGWGNNTLGNGGGNDDDDDDYYDDDDDDDDYYDDENVTDSNDNQEDKLVVIDGGDGNDRITNYGRRVSINAGDGDNYIYNEKYGSRSYRINGSYDSSQDHDAYEKYSSSYYYYQYGGYRVTIKSGDGNDTIKNTDANFVKVDAGAGSNYVSLSNSSYIGVNTGSDNDTIRGYEISSSTLNVGDGNNLVSLRYGSNNNINSGAGDDSVYNGSSNTTINSGAGNDYINATGTDMTVNGGAGNDSIKSTGTNVLFTYTAGDGNDVIEGMTETDTLQICNGTFTTVANGDDVIVTVGEGQITLVGGVSKSVYVETEQPIWRINNTTATYGTTGNPFVTVIGVKSLDGISLNGTTVTVASSSLNKSNVSISTGYTLALANDVTAPKTTAANWSLSDSTTAIYKSAKTTAGYSLVNGQIIYTPDSGDETLIKVEGVKSIDGISLNGTTVTVANASLYQTTVKINDGYTLKIGNDVSEPTTLAAHFDGTTYKSASNTAGYSLVNNQIVYTAAKSANSLFVLTGANITDAITINTTNKTVKLAAENLNQSPVSVSDDYTLLIADDVTTPKTTAAGWSLSGTTATYKNSSTSAGYSIINNQIVYNTASGGATLVTVTGVKSADGLNLNGSTVMVAASALNQAKVTISDGYNLALADDVTKSATTAAGWHLNGDIATYKEAATSTGYSVVNNQIVYNTASGGATLITVEGVKSLNGISLSGTTVTLAASALNQAAVTISDGYNLALADDVTKTKTTAAGWTINGNVATYKNVSTSAGYSISNNQVVYTPNSGGETLATVSGVKSKDGLSLSGSTVTIAASALNQANVSISDGYNLALADDVTLSKTTAAGWNLNGSTATYKTASTSAGYSLVNNQILYKSDSGGDTLAKVNGIKSKDGLSLSGKTVTVAAKSLNKTNVTINSGYTLKLADDVTQSKTTAAGWSLSGSTATYKTASISAGYKLSNNRITYNAANGGATLVTVSGVKSKDGLSLSGTTITVAKSALGTGKVTVSDGYTLTLDDDVSSPAKTKTWSYKSSVATYTQKTSAGYTLAANAKSISYTADAKKTLATVSGVKSKDGITVSGKVVTVAASALNKKKVTLSGSGYKLAIASDVSKPKTSNAWSYKDSVATYAKTTSAGYKLASDGKSIAYSKKATENLLTVSGVKAASGLSIKDKIVTVAKAALGTDKVTISDGYTLALGKNVKQPTKSSASWSHASSTATYKSSATTAGYTLAGDGKSISYSKAKDAATLATITGVKSTVNPAVEDNVITLTKAALSTNKVTVNGKGYEFNFAKGDYKKTAITGSANADKITSHGSNLSITGGKGNDSISLGSDAKNNVIVYNSGDGKDVITNFSTSNKLKIKSGTAKITTDGDDVIFTVGKGSVTFKDAKSKVINYVDKNGKELAYTGNSVTITGSTIKLLPSYLNNTFNIADYGSKLQTIDAAAVQLDISITGNALMNSIRGGKGNDTLKGGGSNDTLTGGDGADVFVYDSGDGNDVITDYSAEDVIRFTSGTAKVAKSGKNVVFTLGKGKLTVTGGASKVITYTDSTGEHTYPEVVKVNDTGNGITILESYMKDSFDVADYGEKLQTIDASAVTHDLEITGNKLANSILGSVNNETLNGGKGNDTLTGGDGSDVFIYSAGNDLITDYAEEDKIKIASGKIKSVKKSGSNVIFTVGSNKITVKGAASKTVTYVDASGKTKYFPTTPKSAVIMTDNKTTAILRETYSESAYTAGSSIKKIDASAVTRDLSITGNGKANVILGGYQNDTIYGGKGNDTLQGGTGADVFVYANGDGNDRIIDYAEEDTIKITSGKIKNKTTKDDDVIFTIGSGKITVLGAADKTVSYVEGGETKTYGGSTANVLEDDNFITGNDLSSIVESKAVDYAFAKMETQLTASNVLPSVTYSSKK